MKEIGKMIRKVSSLTKRIEKLWKRYIYWVLLKEKLDWDDQEGMRWFFENLKGLVEEGMKKGIKEFMFGVLTFRY